MCFTKSVYTAADDFLTEVLRRVPNAALVKVWGDIVLQSLVTETFGEGSNTRIGRKTQEQMRQLLRRMSYRLPTDKQWPLLLGGQEPESKGKLKSLSSAPVRIVRKRLLENVMPLCSKATMAEIIKEACCASQSRLQGDDQGRVRREFFRPLAEDFIARGGEPTKSLVITVDLESESVQLKLPIEDPEEEAPDEATASSPDGLSFHIPTFDEYAEVFSKYPYVQPVWFEGRMVLAIGSAQTRSDSNRLYRRTCEVDLNDGGGRLLFKRLITPYCRPLKREEGDRHLILKLVPFRPGTRIRFWTNVKDEGDIELYYRYLLITDDPTQPIKHYLSVSQLDEAYAELTNRLKG